MVGCFGFSDFDKYLESKVIEHCSDNDESELEVCSECLGYYDKDMIDEATEKCFLCLEGVEENE